MLVIFEGVDGAGKTTAMQGFCNWVESTSGKAVVRTREPGGTAIAEQIRSFIFANKLWPLTEALLMFAARSEHWRDLLRMHYLADGHSVTVTDRFIASSYVYQVKEGGVPWETFNQLVEMLYREEARLQSVSNPEYLADLEFVFDVDYEVACSRLAGRGDKNRLDFQTKESFDGRRESYKHILDPRVNTWSQSMFLIDANGTPENTLQQCIAAYQHLREVRA